MPDAFSWIAYYADGSSLCETDADGKVIHTMAEIDQKSLRAFALTPIRDGLSSIVVAFTGRQRLIFFRRSGVPVPGDASCGHDQPAFTAVGWQKAVNGRNVKAIWWVFDDGSAILSDRDLDELR